jgi:hypothetical protein
VTANDQGRDGVAASPAWAERLSRIGIDWWATIVAGVVVLLAMARLLVKIPW